MIRCLSASVGWLSCVRWLRAADEWKCRSRFPNSHATPVSHPAGIASKSHCFNAGTEADSWASPVCRMVGIGSLCVDDIKKTSLKEPDCLPAYWICGLFRKEFLHSPSAIPEHIPWTAWTLFKSLRTHSCEVARSWLNISLSKRKLQTEPSDVCLNPDLVLLCFPSIATWFSIVLQPSSTSNFGDRFSLSRSGSHSALQTSLFLNFFTIAFCPITQLHAYMFSMVTLQLLRRILICSPIENSTRLLHSPTVSYSLLQFKVKSLSDNFWSCQAAQADNFIRTRTLGSLLCNGKRVNARWADGQSSSSNHCGR